MDKIDKTEKVYKKTGYLNSKFKIFHLSDSTELDIDFHYHDFHKILIHLQGDVTYCIEGRNYNLSPYDIVFVNAGEVHRPLIKSSCNYDRIIIYISSDFLAEHNQDNNDLSLCLRNAAAQGSHVLRLSAFTSTRLGAVTAELVNSLNDNKYANELYQEVLFLEFMIQLNRAAIDNKLEYISTSYSNSKIISIINYLNNNLTKDISIEYLSEKFFISRYHLMHLFKDETGYSIGNYLSTKRLLKARELILSGVPITDACYQSGFKNYSTFSRAYKKAFNNPPKNDLLLLR